jgi:hypothetical protein
MGNELVSSEGKLRTYNSELGKAGDSELGAAGSIAIENDHPDGPYHSNRQPYHHDLTE